MTNSETFPDYWIGQLLRERGTGDLYRVLHQCDDGMIVIGRKDGWRYLLTSVARMDERYDEYAERDLEGL